MVIFKLEYFCAQVLWPPSTAERAVLREKLVAAGGTAGEVALLSGRVCVSLEHNLHNL